MPQVQMSSQEGPDYIVNGSAGLELNLLAVPQDPDMRELDKTQVETIKDSLHHWGYPRLDGKQPIVICFEGN